MHIVIATGLVASLASSAAAADTKTADGVIAADRAWGLAEVSGDVSLLNRLLAPGYVSVAPDGKVTPKELIVAKVAGRSKQELEKLRTSVAAWKAAHPLRPEVALTGDTAVLKWVPTGAAGTGTVSSCDIFVYRGGHWRAVYSQHSSAAS